MNDYYDAPADVGSAHGPSASSRARANGGPRFAHPIEAKFARILDFYGIRWEYEPRTFPLEWDDEGHVTLGLAPDFYLVDQDLYVELTTLRPKLNRIKNRKIRRLQELYPDIQIKLFKRRDLRDLMTKYGMDQDAARLVGTDAQEPAL